MRVGGKMSQIIKTTTPGAAGYSRPADWLALPAVVAGEHTVVGLYAVYDTDSNFIAFSCRGAYHVDWGDGNEEDVADNVTAEHVYDYADLGAGTLSTRGYRQAIVVITMQGAEVFTVADFTQTHSQAGLNDYSTAWLDVRMAGADVTSVKFGGGDRESRMLEQFEYVGGNSIASMDSMFRDCVSLQSVPLFDTSSATSMTYMFYGCHTLQSVPLFDTSIVTDMSDMFRACYSIQIIPLFDTSSATLTHDMFSYCYSLQTVPLFDTSSVTTNYYMFRYCYALQTLPALDFSSATNMAGIVERCYSLQAAPFAGTRTSVSYASCRLAHAAIVDIFNGLAVRVRTITITGNWGIPNLTAADRLIATAKGWTIVE